jgi:hypothetical protein
MTLGNMRANGVRSLDVTCWQCHHRAIMSADPWPVDAPVPTFGPRMVCTRCGIVGADARPPFLGQRRCDADLFACRSCKASSPTQGMAEATPRVSIFYSFW